MTNSKIILRKIIPADQKRRHSWRPSSYEYPATTLPPQYYPAAWPWWPACRCVPATNSTCRTAVGHPSRAPRTYLRRDAKVKTVVALCSPGIRSSVLPTRRAAESPLAGSPETRARVRSPALAMALWRWLVDCRDA